MQLTWIILITFGLIRLLHIRTVCYVIGANLFKSTFRVVVKLFFPQSVLMCVSVCALFNAFKGPVCQY